MSLQRIKVQSISGCTEGVKSLNGVDEWQSWLDAIFALQSESRL